MGRRGAGRLNRPFAKSGIQSVGRPVPRARTCHVYPLKYGARERERTTVIEKETRRKKERREEEERE